MATAPTAKDAALEILRIEVRNRGARVGDAILAASLIPFFANPPWRPSDIADGLEHGIAQGWLSTDLKIRLPDTLPRHKCIAARLSINVA